MTEQDDMFADPIIPHGLDVGKVLTRAAHTSATRGGRKVFIGDLSIEGNENAELDGKHNVFLVVERAK